MLKRITDHGMLLLNCLMHLTWPLANTAGQTTSFIAVLQPFYLYGNILRNVRPILLQLAGHSAGSVLLTAIHMKGGSSRGQPILISPGVWETGLDGLEMHHIVVEDWERGVQAEQNVTLVSIASIQDPKLAPKGKHTLHAYHPATEPYAPWEHLQVRVPPAIHAIGQLCTNQMIFSRALQQQYDAKGQAAQKKP